MRVYKKYFEVEKDKNKNIKRVYYNDGRHPLTHIVTYPAQFTNKELIEKAYKFCNRFLVMPTTTLENECIEMFLRNESFDLHCDLRLYLYDRYTTEIRIVEYKDVLAYKFYNRGAAKEISEETDENSRAAAYIRLYFSDGSVATFCYNSVLGYAITHVYPYEYTTEAAAEIANENNEEIEEIKMEGTEKQVKWAKEIIENFYRQFELKIQHCEAEYKKCPQATFYLVDMEIYKRVMEDLKHHIDHIRFAERIINIQEMLTAERIEYAAAQMKRKLSESEKEKIIKDYQIQEKCQEWYDEVINNDIDNKGDYNPYAAAEIANSENTDNEQINRYWYTTESVNETLPDYVGLFESAVKKGQEYANKLQEIVYVNLVEDIVQVIVPDNNEDVSRETYGLYDSGKIIKQEKRMGYDATQEGLEDTSLETEESLAAEYKEYVNRLYGINSKAARISFINSELQRLAGLEEHDALDLATLIVKNLGYEKIYELFYYKGGLILIKINSEPIYIAFNIENVDKVIQLLKEGNLSFIVNLN